jgi:hypothetical protein
MSANPAAALASTATPLGSSKLTELQRCPTAHHLRYVVGIETKHKAGYFRTGSFVHACARYINEGVIAGEPAGSREWESVIEAAREERAAKIAAGLELEPTWDQKDPIDEAERLVGAYYGFHGIENGGWPAGVKLLHAEKPLASKLVRATACADLIVDVGGEIVIPDLKTRAKALPSDRKAFEREERCNEEFLRLSALLQEEMGLSEPPPVWLDAIIKTKIPSVDRLLIRFTQADIDAWRENARALDEHAALSAKHHLPVVKNYHECRPAFGGGRCWAFDWCHGSEESRALHYRRREEAR